MTYDVIARDASLARTGPVPFLTMTAVPRFNAISTWELSLDAASDAAGLLTAGAGAIIRKRKPDGSTATIMSGPVAKVREEATAGKTTLLVSGVDDTAWLWARGIYPDPTVPSGDQLSGTGDSRTGVLETVMRQLVDLNLGPGALLARRLAGLTLAADGLHGPTVTSEAAEFAILGEHLTALALNGGLGFRIVQVGAGLEFQVYAPEDKSMTARFSFRLRNLRGYTIETTAPEATVAIVAAGDDNSLRFFTEHTNADSEAAQADWGGVRRESFAEKRDSVDTDVVAQAGDEYLAQHGPGVGIDLDPIDTPDMAYAVHYGLGDKVTVTTGGGPIVNVVRQATITAAGDGPATVKALVGTADGPVPDVPRSYQLLRQVLTDLGLLKRRL